MQQALGSEAQLDHKFFIGQQDLLTYVHTQPVNWLAFSSHDLCADEQLAASIRQRPAATRCLLCVLPEAPPLEAIWPLAKSAIVDVVCTLAELPACLQAASARQYYSSSLLRPLAAAEAPPPAATAYWQALTFSEKRVLTQLLHGYSRRETADLLFISPRTVDNHKANIAAKLGAMHGPHGFGRFLASHKETLLAWLTAAT